MENPIDQNPVNESPIPNQVAAAQANVEASLAIIRSKGSWFFWIAGLSLLNSFLAAKGTYFIVGLAMSQFIDGIVMAATGDVNYFVSLVVPAIFATFGYFACKGNRWAFIVGGILYILDGVLYLFFEEWFAAGFHLFVLYNLYRGYQEITEYEDALGQLG